MVYNYYPYYVPPVVNYNVVYPAPNPNAAPTVYSSTPDNQPLPDPAPYPNTTPSSQPEDDSANTNPAGSNVIAPAPAVVLYLKDGTTYTATDYWVADNELHYVADSGEEGTIFIDQLDTQRTVDENAKRGVTFTLTPTSRTATPASSRDIVTPPTTAGPNAAPAGPQG